MITRTKISPSTEKAIETAQSASQKFSSGSFYCFNLVINRDKGVVVWDFFWDNPEEYQIPSSVKSNVIAVANGYTHCLALKASGKVIAWGNNEFGQCNVPSTAKKDVVAIAAGDAYSLALKADGEVVAWGNNQYGQCNVPASAKKDVVAIASDAGGYHSLALTSNGQVIAWGSNGEGRCNVPSTAKKDVVTIAAGVFHSLALKTNGEVVAWGNNHSGQCNVPTTAKKDIIAIAAGTHHSLALTANGEVIAWGEYHDKQYNIPAFVNKDIVAINTSGYNSLLLKANGDLIYWRIDDYIVLNIYQELKSGLIKNPAEISLYLGDNSSYINGKFCRMDVLPHIDSNNGLMLPLRVIAEALGADILWLPLDRKIHLKDGNNDVILAIGSDQILVNNVPMKIKCSPIIVNPGRTFVSDEFFSKILDAKVTRNNADTEFLITREHKD
ncbi:MAG: stalk domain-containing protein [Clostridia bacterium]|nr:stalk domain-containing protein [Clostridia bacterium]